jgi:formylmethanofuran dehydrogenase subunit E
MPMSNLYTEVFRTDLQEKLRNPEASFALSHWLITRRNRAMPEETEFAIKAVDWLKQDMMIIRRNAEGELYYDHYGSRIAQHAGFDMTGKKVSDFKGESGQFYQNTYNELFANPLAMGTVHRLGHFKERPLWERVLLPLASHGEVTAIYVVNRILDLDHEFNIASARAKSSSIIAMQFERETTGTIKAGIIVGANKMAMTLCNRRLDEMVGVSMHDCFPGIVEKGLWSKYLDVHATKQPCNFILQYDQDGMVGSYDVTLSPFRDGVLIDFILSTLHV